MVAALGVASCTLLGTREIRQCDVDDDCVASPLNQRGPPQCIDHLCSARQTALPPEAEPPDTGPLETGPDAPPQGCKKSAECTDQGQICVSGACRTLVTADDGPCPLLANNGVVNSYREDGALIVGIYVFDPKSLGAEVKAAEAALQKVNESLPKASQISAVFCSKADKLAKGSAQSAINHLDGLGVPLLVGQLEATELAAVDPKKLALWSTLGNLPTLHGNPKVRLLVDELQKLRPGYTAALAEAAVRADKLHATTFGTNVKITLVTNGQSESTLLVDRLEAEEPLLQAGQSNYARATVELKPDFETLGTAQNGGVAQAVVAALPQIIIAVGGDELITLMTNVEGPLGWPVASKRPVWVLNTRGKFTAKALSTLASTGTLRTRVIGVDFGGDSANQIAYRAVIPAGVAQAGSFDNIYDAMFVTSFASSRAFFTRGAAATALTGADLSRGLDEVLRPSGSSDLVMDAVGQYPPTATGVATGKTLFFTGTTGPWLFADGSRRDMGTSYYCFHGSELTYYVDSAALANVFSCQRPP